MPKTVDNLKRVLEAVAKMTTADVLVGVPAEKAPRRDGQVTNAMLAYIHEFGSVAQHIPPRPFLFPGVRNAREQIAAVMRDGARQVLKGDTAAVNRTLNAAGMLARNAVVKAITDPSPPFQPLRPATIRARLRKTAAGRRQYSALKNKAAGAGVSMDQALSSWASGNIKPLIDTGQLRASITYVVRENALKPYTTDWGYQRDYGKVRTK